MHRATADELVDEQPELCRRSEGRVSGGGRRGGEGDVMTPLTPVGAADTTLSPPTNHTCHCTALHCTYGSAPADA
ncbi:hypothetical protein B296_00029830 [Ensete ventricosum]|uniref:Uncharacterized protein n=1 Tax=Ensete ventricosum TaxID=4639 RepID=A0A427AKB4_ENSVE|nr:hypothetical protein B296_00029830 [Ensete ventricosum]